MNGLIHTSIEYRIFQLKVCPKITGRDLRFGYNFFNITSIFIILSALKGKWKALHYPWSFFSKKVKKKMRNWRRRKSTSLLLRLYWSMSYLWIPLSSPMLNMQMVFGCESYFSRTIKFSTHDWRWNNVL